MAVLTRLCLRYRWIVVACWLAALVGGMAWSSSLGATYSQNFGVTGSDSQQAIDLLPKVVPGGTLFDTETVVLHARMGTVRDQVFRAEVTAMRTRIAKLPGVLLATDPYGASGAVAIGVAPISANNRTALMSVIFKSSQFAPDLGAVRRVIAVARGYGGPNLQVEVAGGGATAIAQRSLSRTPFLAGILVALIVLCLTVRSWAGVAACAGVAGATAVGVVSVVTVLSRHFEMTTFAPLMAALLGLGMTLGGAIVVISRMQSGLRAGLEATDAATAAMTRPGRANVQASLGVALVMVGTLFLRLKVFDGIALAALGAAAVSVLLVMTLLPAILGICGHHLLGWTERTHLRTTGTALPRRPGFRTLWAGLVHRQPRLVAGAALLALTLMAIPGLGLRLGGSDPGVDPTSMSTRRAYDLISSDFFPGLNGPLVVVAQGDVSSDPAVVTRLVRGLGDTPGVNKAFVVATNAKQGLAMIQVLPKYDPRAAATTDLIRRLRNDTVPVATRGTTLAVHISGQNALFGDMAHRFDQELPAFLVLELLVIGLTVLIRLRSLLLALAVTATSLLVTAATLGVLTVDFEKVRLAKMLGVQVGPIEPFLLVFVLVAVFGLSLGMHLCLLSRMREPDTGDQDDREAIRTGHAEAGHVVLTISLIMLVIFVSVAAQEPRTMKVLGFGLAIGVAL
ncbi:MAG: MMPL family transporter, partial [Frankia sp.]